MPTRVRHRVFGQCEPHHGQRLFEQLVALVVVDAQRVELTAQIAGRDTEGQPPTREHVETQHTLRGEERIAIRQHHDVGLHPQRRRRRGGERQRDERIERVMTARVEPLLISGRMIRDVHRVEAERLGVARHLGDRRAGEELVRRVDLRGGETQSEPHAPEAPRNAVSRASG
jgi:hypothetical protein